MRIHITTLAALLCAAAALRPSPAAAQADTVAAAGTDTTIAAAEAGGANRDAPTPRTPHARRSLNFITYEEVRTSHAPDVYELIHSLRPSWLRTPRGSISLTAQIDVAVFKDGTRLGTRDALRSIPITVVRTIRFYSAVDARQKFGGNTSAGAIEISSQ